LHNEKISFRSLFDRDTILHLRLPFSFFLLPVFVFGISQASNIHATNAFIVFFALHFFIYPGSNIYNSYMDKDTGSIGGLKHPPPVTPKLYYASMVMDIAGLAICALAGWENALIMSGYVAFSKAYSWHGIRLKKYPYLGWLMVAFFQGGYTFLLANTAAENVFDISWFTGKNLTCMLIATLLIGAYYPLTQIYQHDEDSERGDFTISYKLGIKGTFIFSAALFLIGFIVAYRYFIEYYSVQQFALFGFSLLPVMSYFFYWFVKTMKDFKNADYSHAMKMTFVSSVCIVTCFLIILMINGGWVTI
jgi:1,4-dihydroxy-2-naphthoate octaprenyltransferase